MNELTLHAVELRLRELGKRYTVHGNRIRAQCPCHDDREPSLIVEWYRGRVWVKCFAGCDPQQIMGVLLGDAKNVVTRSTDTTQVDTMLGLEILTRVWDNIEASAQKMALEEISRRGINHNNYLLADADYVVRLLRQTAVSTDLVRAGLAYQRDGSVQMRRVFNRGRILIPYFRGGRVVSLRSRKVIDDGLPKYLSLRGYPARCYVARARVGTKLLVVEGEFKAMVLADRLPDDISVVALPGVTAAWDDLKRLCDHYIFTRRYVLFDSEQNNPQVDRAARGVAKRIDGIQLHIPLMDGERRIAPDEFVIQYGVEPIYEALK